MYKENEIAKARYAVLAKTNMLEYACEVYNGIYKDQTSPKGLNCINSFIIELTSRIPSIKERHEEIHQSPIMECVEECLQDLEETGTLPVLTEEDLADFEVPVSNCFHCRSLALILMSVTRLPSF